MNLVTLISDYGTLHNGIALMKLGLFDKNKDLEIFEISNNIDRGDAFRAALELLEIVEYAPQNTIHCVAVENLNHHAKALVYFSIHKQHFIMPDNGIAYLLKILLGLDVLNVYSIPAVPGYPDALYALTFPFVINRILSGKILDIASPYKDFELRPSKPISEPYALIGMVLFNNHLGDAITNIHINDLMHFQNKNLEAIKFGYQKSHEVYEINSHKYEVKKGNVFCVINSSGFLTIGISFGDAKKLLGLDPAKKIQVIFS
jgi:S-adenosylmethionine hydrolase